MSETFDHIIINGRPGGVNRNLSISLRRRLLKNAKSCSTSANSLLKMTSYGFGKNSKKTICGNRSVASASSRKNIRLVMSNSKIGIRPTISAI